LQADQIQVVIQINGKARSRVTLPASASEEEIRNAALNDPKVQQRTEGKQVLKSIVVGKKLVNLVVK